MKTIRSPSSVECAVEQAVAFLTRPLTSFIPAAQVTLLGTTLSSSLVLHFGPSWCPSEPARGSGRRCLTLAPGRLPPRVIYLAAKHVSVDWERWMAALGGRELDLFVDPGRVRVRFAGDMQDRLVWSAFSPTISSPGTRETSTRGAVRTSLRNVMVAAVRTRVQNSLTLRTDLATYIASDDDEEGLPSSPDPSFSSISSDADSVFSVGNESTCSSASMPSIIFTPASPVKTRMPIPPRLPSSASAALRRDSLRRAGILISPSASLRLSHGETTPTHRRVRLDATKLLGRRCQNAPTVLSV